VVALFAAIPMSATAKHRGPAVKNAARYCKAQRSQMGATAFQATYGGKSEPVADKSKYKPKQFYIEHLAAVREQIYSKLKTLTDADLAKPHPDPARRERMPTIGHAITFYGTWHEAYHSGQLSTWRRVQGLPPV
jgi:uncharacterized damage-inducible protein DinB